MKKFKTLFILPVLLIGLATPAKAATRDFVNVNTGEVTTATDWRSNDATLNDLIDKLSNNPDDYAIQFGGKYYKYSGLLNAIAHKPKTQTTSEAFTAALNDSSLVITVNVSTDFDVISID